MKKKTAVCFFVFFLLFSGGAGFLAFSVLEREAAVERLAADAEAVASQSAGRVEAVARDTRAAETYEDWVRLFERVSELPPEGRMVLENPVQTKLFESRAIERDNLLFYAARLEQIRKGDPLAQAYLEEAKKLHEANMEIIESVAERKDDCAWNAVLWYRKGLEYVRALFFVPNDDKGKARDLIARAKEHFEKVFSCFPRDRDAEVAIELLYQEAERRNAGSDSNTLADRLRLLPSEEVGPGTSSGFSTSPREEGRM